MNNNKFVKTYNKFINEESEEYKNNEFKPEIASRAIVDNLYYIYSYIEEDETEEGEIAKGKVMDAINQANNLVEYFNKK